MRLRGRLLVAPDQAHERLLPRFRLLGRTPLLRRSDDGIRQEVLALPVTFTPTKARPVLALALFGLTVLSCLFVGAQMWEWVGASGQINTNLLDGVPFAATTTGDPGARTSSAII